MKALTLGCHCLGCNFCQELARDLQRQVLPKLREAGYKLYLVGAPAMAATRLSAGVAMPVIDS